MAAPGWRLMSTASKPTARFLVSGAVLYGLTCRYGFLVATLEDVAQITAGLPEVTEGERHGNLTWFVRGQAFAWDRPFSKADLRRFGDDTPPAGPILAVRVADLDDKQALLATGQRGLFTIPHFDGYAAVLIQLSAVGKKVLREAVTDAWLARAPADLARSYLQR